MSPLKDVPEDTDAFALFRKFTEAEPLDLDGVLELEEHAEPRPLVGRQAEYALAVHEYVCP